MNKLLVLLVLVGCGNADQSIKNIESEYPFLRCAASDTGAGPYLCKNLDGEPYLCYSTGSAFPHNVVCTYGAVPQRESFKYTVKGNITDGKVDTSKYDIGTYIQVSP